jgi:hypothetical protein
MKKKIITFLLLFATVVSYRVYDRQGKLIEVWKDRGAVIDVYDHQMARKGFIKKERNQWSRYDKEWNIQATIERADNGTVSIDEVSK